jgi:hypothetical protein
MDLAKVDQICQHVWEIKTVLSMQITAINLSVLYYH